MNSVTSTLQPLIAQATMTMPACPLLPWSQDVASATMDAFTASLGSTPVAGGPGLSAAAFSAPASAPVPATTAATTSVTAAAPAANPWPELEGIGLLASTAAVPGPLGVALSQAAQDGLHEVARRIESAGARFEEKHGWFGSVLAGGKFSPLTADAFVDKMVNVGIEEKSGFAVSVAGHEHIPVRSLSDLQCLDAVHGLGPDAAGANAPVVRAVTSLEQHGWKLDTRVWGDSEWLDFEGSYAALSHMKNGVRIGARQPASPGKGYSISQGNALLFEYAWGSGTDWGLSDPATAVAIRDLKDHGCVLSHDNGSSYGKGLWEFVQDRLPDQFRIGLEKGLKVAATPSDLANLPALYRRIDQGQRLWDDYGKALVDAPNRDDWAGNFADAALDGSVAPFLAPEQRAEFLGKLMQAAERRGRPDLDQAATDLAALARAASDTDRMRREVDWYAGLLDSRLKWEGDRQGNALLRVRDRLRLEAADPADYAWVQGALARLVSDMGDVGRSLEALDVVRITGADDTPDERLDMLCRIARATRDDQKARVVSDFRVLAGQRLPGESLAQAFERYEALLGSLVGDARDRASDVFVAVQQRARSEGGGAERADALLARFLESLVHQPSVDVAMQAMEREADPGHAQAGSVRREEDGTLVIGGVRLSPNRQEAA